MPPSADLRPRRSVLYVPASNPRAMAKAAFLPVDGLVLDLEDAVAPEAKPAARQAACAAVRSGDHGPREVVVRVNGVSTAWHDDDLAAACAAGSDAILVPKVDSPQVVRELVEALEEHRAAMTTQLWVMLETPSAVLRAAEIAAAADRLTVLVMGTNDLLEELSAAAVPGRQPLVTALQLGVLAARAAGKVILDGVFNDISDVEGFLAECRQGRELGFDGKTLIHPGQIAGANATYAPDPRAVAEARGVLAAWEARRDSGVVTYAGRMVEGLHVEAARRVLAVNDAVVAHDEELS